MELADQEQIREVLIHELTRRVARNPRYSMRAFSTQLGISHSLLSLVLSKRRRVTEKTLSRVCEALDAKRDEVLGDSNAYHRFPTQDFEAISDWFHYAILSLLEIKGFRMDPRWISNRLGISAAQARLAIERMRSMGILIRIKGRWRQSTKPLVVDNTIARPKIRTHHKQLLQKAEEALDSTLFEERDYSAMTFAMDPANILIAKEKIKTFRRSLVRELERQGRRTEVYQFNLQLFPLSKKERKT